MVEVVAPPGDQVYEVPPLAVKVTNPPLQILKEDGVIETTGLGNTVRFKVRVPTQPAALVPLTVYTVVEAGLTLTVLPMLPPGFQV